MINLIILDRDGVINVDSKEFVKSEDEWIPIPGSLKAIAQLNQLGFTIALATNQSGLGRGLFTMDDLSRMHLKMHKLLEKMGGKIEASFFCPHLPDDDCECRKPKPGLLHDACKRLGVAPENVYAVGDSFRDIQAAWNAGCKPVLVLTGNGEKTLAENKAQLADVDYFADLAAFAQSLHNCSA